MSKRASQIILLCEDRAQAMLVNAFLRRHNIAQRTIRRLVAAELKHGGNVADVIEWFAVELHACRQQSRLA